MSAENEHGHFHHQHVEREPTNRTLSVSCEDLCNRLRTERICRIHLAKFVSCMEEQRDGIKFGWTPDDAVVEEITISMKRCRTRSIKRCESIDYDRSDQDSSVNENDTAKHLEQEHGTIRSQRSFSLIMTMLEKTRKLKQLEFELVCFDKSRLRAVIKLMSTDLTQLIWLGLEGCRMRGAIDNDWDTLFSALPHWQRLRVLDLTNTNLTATSMTRLSPTIANMPHLQSVILCENPIGDAGVRILCQHALRSHPSIKILSLGDCDMNLAGLEDICQCVRYNCQLQRVYVYCNHFDRDGGCKKELNFWLDANCKGRTLLSSHDDLVCAMMPRILAKSSSDVAILHVLLMELPYLWVGGVADSKRRGRKKDKLLLIE